MSRVTKKPLQLIKALVNVYTLLPMMFLGLRKLGNICCGHKMLLNKIRNGFCVLNKCCARGQTVKHLCRQQCVRNNVSSFARALSSIQLCSTGILFASVICSAPPAFVNTGKAGADLGGGYRGRTPSLLR